MTKVKVFGGVCGFSTVIKVSSLGKLIVKVEIISACKPVKDMSLDLDEVDCKKVFSRIFDSTIYQSANKRLKHTDCIVPAGIIKAIQVEIGAALPKNATITFED
ncbi:MAG: hypothetical protein KGZ96_06305 [Clostridia bacterium]|nr:hypothetical protein [Clostridia bacterium]